VSAPSRIVDALPLRFWQPGNVYLGGRLHFCTAGVRTIEWNGREVGRGEKPFPYEEAKRRWPDAWSGPSG
jgi:hypothetical protein